MLTKFSCVLIFMGKRTRENMHVYGTVLDFATQNFMLHFHELRHSCVLSGNDSVNMHLTTSKCNPTHFFCQTMPKSVLCNGCCTGQDFAAIELMCSIFKNMCNCAIAV